MFDGDRTTAANGGAAALDRLIGVSPGIREVRNQICKVARSPIPVFILGETGTGKELCAEAIFHLSGCRPFVPVNCAAFPETLIDAELFGYVKGAFTGAIRDRPGLVALADGGVLFLDELAEISHAAQVKLLRTLESGEYRPVGCQQTRRATFRILAATSGDLEKVMNSGQLRSDLVYRLGAMRILLPPLRDRMEDLPLLLDEFLRRYREQAQRGPTRISRGALSLLADHPWHGNLRELKNVVEAASALAGDRDEIRPRDLVPLLAPRQVWKRAPASVSSLSEVLNHAERRALHDALRFARGNRARAAALMGISEATLYRKLAKHRQVRSTA